jgi:hypothetical protein
MCLQELLAIQQNDGPKNLGFFGTRNMGMTHQKLVEILSYAMVSTVSAAAGTWTPAQRSALQHTAALLSSSAVRYSNAAHDAQRDKS